MFLNLFKSKPTLKELIPNGFVDIHSHILPGIDDGAKNIEESIELIKKMKNLGFSKIIGTPHTYPGLYNNTSDSIIKSYERLKKKLTQNINIDYASEYLIDNSILKKLNTNSILCLKEKHILLETSFLGAVDNIFEIIYELRVNDYIPIIAHPERYLYAYEKKLKFFKKLRRQGCKFQINLLSLTGHYGNNVVYLCDSLLKRDFIDFVGSDIHSIRHIEGFSNKVKIKEIEKVKIAIDSNLYFK